MLIIYVMLLRGMQNIESLFSKKRKGKGMLKIEMKKCKKCGKTYTWKSGGIAANPKDFMDFGMCTVCTERVL